MGEVIPIFAGLLALVALIALAWFLLRYIAFPVVGLVGRAIGRFFTFVGATIGDAFRLVGAAMTSAFYIPIILGTVLIGRWSASRHLGAGLIKEFKLGGLAVYRLVIGNLMRLFGVKDAVAGIEERLPQAFAELPGADVPRSKQGQFEGYTIVGTLAGGGSGGKLYVADPDAIKVAGFERNGHYSVDQVVIKSFSLRDGSSLPQIVRESRSLDAAKKLGLVLDHQLTPERFFYVMRYVPGQSLSAVTHQLHAESTTEGKKGLDDGHLRRALGLVADLLGTLEAYHKGGLWHKDVKPDNIIVDGKRAHLVDFGLVTPLRSAMTLTTHGTEYFRDPEMVRLALKGVKVHEVDGAKFDIFGAGAVLYSVVENAFPAHGVLSPVNARCPEALRWIIRRAMADYDKRYARAGDMLRDLETVRMAADPMSVKPGHLPSVAAQNADEESASEPVPDPMIAAVHEARSAVASGGNARGAGATPPPIPAGAAHASASLGGAARGAGSGRGVRTGIRIKNWWTGEFETDAVASGGAGVESEPARGGAARAVHEGGRRSAHEQVDRARSRAAAARERIRAKVAARSIKRSYSNNPNAGVMMSAAIAVGGMVLILASIFSVARARTVASEPSPMPTTMESPAWKARGVPRDTSGVVARQASTARQASMSIEPPKARPGADGIGGEGSEGSVVMVVDLRPPIAKEHQEAIEAMVGRLREEGFGVRGETLLLEESAGDVDLKASALLALGSQSIDTALGYGAVAAWLGREKPADLVVWIMATAVKGSKTTEASLPQLVAVVVREADEGLDVKARQTLSALEKRCWKAIQE